MEETKEWNWLGEVEEDEKEQKTRKEQQKERMLNMSDRYWIRTKFNDWNNKWLERKAREIKKEEDFIRQKIMEEGDRLKKREISLMAKGKHKFKCRDDKEEFEQRYVWIGDSGASSHMTSQKEGYVKFKKTLSLRVVWQRREK